jgi:2-polyprenyl-3-methyl-5-hydroxy-6-metoxy-1,4-benzoquinol methylase
MDVGCANGDFARFMKSQGWSVEGVEVSSNAKAIKDFPIYQDDFSAIELQQANYDVVTAWAVMEHAHDPMSYFVKASSILKKDGLFVFLVTNFKSASSRYLYCEDVPRHLFFFTDATIERYCELSGLEVTKRYNDSRIYGMHPVNWLLHLRSKYSKNKALNYSDLPISRSRYIENKKDASNVVNNIKYATFLARNPLHILDRILMPFYAGYQMATKSYGIVTYIARKR